MILPPENLVFAYPQSVKVGDVRIRPLTVGKAIVLAAFGIDPLSDVPAEYVPIAAWILSVPAEKLPDLLSYGVNRFDGRFEDFLVRVQPHGRALASAVKTVLDQAFSTYLNPAGQEGSGSFPQGLGWPLELAETLAAHYGWTLPAILETPVASCWALLAARRGRLGIKHGGPDYVQKMVLKGLKHG